jgi:3-deoxy-7-phosphoheptulonate synthase
MVQIREFEHLPHVKSVQPIHIRYKLASRLCQKHDTVIQVKDVSIGGKALMIAAGPCALESREQIQSCAAAVRQAGGQALRGGCFKPRTSPYEFQGMGEEGVLLLEQAGKDFGLITICEVLDASQIDLLASHVDVLQVGARNMQNFALLKRLGKISNPILLKRGFSATYQEFLMAAEYILSEGNFRVILCERGIRTFETYTRNTLDICAIPALRELTHLPIIVDPSHGTGCRQLVTPMARAAVAAGADGVMIEIHPHPDRSVSDAQQTISFQEFNCLVEQTQAIHRLNKSHEPDEDIGERANGTGAGKRHDPGENDPPGNAPADRVHAAC